MTWLNDPLNTFLLAPYPGDVFGEIWQRGIDLVDDVIAASNSISALALPEPDLSNITLSQTDPSGAVLVLPDEPGLLSIVPAVLGGITNAPAQITIVPPVPGSDPDDARIIRLLDQIEAWLNARLANDTIDTAIFNRAVDRETALMATSYDNYIANNSSNGFSAATGQDINAFFGFEKERKAKLSEQNRDVMIYKFEADQKAIDALQVLESNALNFFNAQEDVMVKRVGLFNDINRIAISLYQADVQAYEITSNVTVARAGAANEINRTEISLYQAEVQAYESTSRMKVEQVRLLNEQINAVNALNANLTNLAMEKVKVLNSYYLGRYQNLAEAQKSIGSTLGQLAATMFNTINYSQSWGQTVGWSGSETGGA